MPILTRIVSAIAGPLVPWLLGAGFFAATVFGAYALGRHDRASEDRSALLQASVDTLKRQAEAAESLLRASNVRIVQLETDAASMKDQVDEYAAILAKRQDTGCILSPDDVSRLLGIGQGRLRSGSGASHAEPTR